MVVPLVRIDPAVHKRARVGAPVQLLLDASPIAVRLRGVRLGDIPQPFFGRVLDRGSSSGSVASVSEDPLAVTIQISGTTR